MKLGIETTRQQHIFWGHKGGKKDETSILMLSTNSTHWLAFQRFQMFCSTWNCYGCSLDSIPQWIACREIVAVGSILAEAMRFFMIQGKRVFRWAQCPSVPKIFFGTLFCPGFKKCMIFIQFYINYFHDDVTRCEKHKWEIHFKYTFFKCLC